MKKIIKVLVMILVLTFIPNKQILPVQAQTTVYINQPAKVPIIVNFPKPVAGFYSTSTGQNGTIGDPLKENYVQSATITAQFTPTQLGDYTITVSFDVADSGANDVSVANKTVVIKVTNPPAPKASNNFLKSLSTNVGNINFNRNTTSYTVIVDHNITSATISGEVEDSKANLSGLGTKQLKVYSNNFPVVVTAENGSQRRYNVNIVRRDEDGLAGPLSKNNNLASLSVEGCELEFNKDVLEYRCEVDPLVDKVNIEAKAEDEKASIKIEQADSIKVGLNEIKVIVTAESEDEKVYVIKVNRSNLAPTIKVDELKDSIGKLPGDEVGIYDEGHVSAETLQLIKDNQKILYVYKHDETGNLLYQWRFDGASMVDAQDINTAVSFISEAQTSINELTNYAQGLVLNFEANPSLPNKTQFGVYVGDRFSEGTLVNLYYYNEEGNTLELKKEGAIVEEEWVWFELSHTSQYFLTPALLGKVKADGINIWQITTIITSLSTLALLGYLIYLKQNKSKA